MKRANYWIWLWRGALAALCLLASKAEAANRAFKISGSKGVLNLPSNVFDGLNEATIEGWFRWDRMGHFSQALAMGEDWHSAGITLYQGLPDVQFYMYSEKREPHVIRVGGAVRPGEWIHLAAVFGSKGMQFYVDGILAGTNAFAGMPLAGPRRIGPALWADNEPFYGMVDELRVWTTARSAEEIKANFHRRLSGREPGLAAFWNFDAGDPSDGSGHGLNGLTQGTAEFPITPEPDFAPGRHPSLINGRIANPASPGGDGLEIRVWRSDQLIGQVLTQEGGAFCVMVDAADDLSVTSTAGNLGARLDGLHCREGEHLLARLDFRPAVSLAGIVRGLDGRLHPGAVVEAVREQSNPDAPLPLAVTDQEGRFTFVNLPAGTYRVRCSTLGATYWLPARKGALASTPAEAVQLELAPGRALPELDFRVPGLKRGRWQRYSFHDGLAPGELSSMTVATDGSLWLGAAHGGLSRFDGSAFKNFPGPDGKGSAGISALAASASGSIWAASSGSLFRFEGERLAEVSGMDPSRRATVNAIAEDRQGRVWLATVRGIACWGGGKWSYYGSEDGLGSMMVNDLAIDREGFAWAATRGGVTRWTGRGGEMLPMPGGLPQSGVGRLELLDNGDYCRGGWGRVSIGAPSAGSRDILLLDYRERVTALRRTRAGAIWAAVAGDGVYRCENGRVLRYGDLDAPGLSSTTAIAESADGRIWFAMAQHGLASFDENGVVTFSTGDGLPSVAVACLAQDTAGRIWAGTDGGMARLDGERWINYTTADGLPSSQVTALKSGADGSLWIGTSRGLARLRPGSDRIESVDASAPIEIQGIEFDSEGSPLAGSQGRGLMRLRGGRLETINDEWGLGAMYIYELYKDRRGALWIGATRFRRTAGGQTVQAGGADGFPGTAPIVSVCDGADGSQWVATELDLLKFQRDRFERPASAAVAPGKIASVAADASGGVWLCGSTGLRHYNGSFWSTFDSRDGLPGDFVQTALRDRNGDVWFGCESGIGRLHFNQTAPKATIEALEFEGELRAAGSAPRVLAGRASKFYFGSIDFKSVPAKRQFRHRVLPRASLDRDGLTPWSALSTERSCSWIPPQPGEYIFELEEVDRDLNISPPARMAFSAVWPWHRNPWIVGPSVLSALALAGLAAGFGWRYRVQRRMSEELRVEMRARERAQQAQRAFARQLIETQEAERQRIAAELHDSLGQNLLVIKSRAALALSQSVEPSFREHIQEVSDAASEALAEARQISHNLRPHQIDSLGLGKALRAMGRKLSDAAGLQFQAEFDDLAGLLEPTQEIQLYRVGQEAMNNIAKHSKAQSVRLSLKRAGGAVRLVIEDDGRGFDKSSDASPGGGGLGLVNMRERMGLIGGTLDLETAPGKGVKIVAEAPLPGASGGAARNI